VRFTLFVVNVVVFSNTLYKNILLFRFLFFFAKEIVGFTTFTTNHSPHSPSNGFKCSKNVVTIFKITAFFARTFLQVGFAGNKNYYISNP